MSERKATTGYLLLTMGLSLKSGGIVMNINGLKTALKNQEVVVSQLDLYKLRFVGDGFAGECELLGGKKSYTKLARMGVDSDYNHEQVLQVQKLVNEWQRSEEK